MGLYDDKISPFVKIAHPHVKNDTLYAIKNHTSAKPNAQTSDVGEGSVGEDAVAGGENVKGSDVDVKNFEEVLRYALSVKKNKEEAVRRAQEVVYCLRQMSERREKLLGKSSRLRNGGKTYSRVVYNILTGNNTYDQELSPEQFCDLYEFTLQHPFWKKFIKSPAGLNRNLLKLWDTDEYNEWSLANGRPAENRNENETSNVQNGTAGESVRNQRKYPNWKNKGVLEADSVYDYDFDYVSPEWNEK